MVNSFSPKSPSVSPKKLTTSRPSLRLSFASPLQWSSTPSIPATPGVYWFVGNNHQVLYVGKAKNLKKRLTSYRPHLNQNPKIKSLLTNTVKLYLQTLPTEYDALIKEAELIKTYQPHFNVKTKDDTAGSYIGITQASFPKVIIFKPGSKTALKYRFKAQYGPYLSHADAHTILNYIRRAFPFCNGNRNTTKTKACLYYHLQLCPGVCLGKISQKDYHQNIRFVEKLLKGQRLSLLSQIRKDILLASSLLNYELAATLNQTYKALKLTPSFSKSKANESIQLDSNDDLFIMRQLTRKLKSSFTLPSAFIISRVECYDISHFSGKEAVAAMTVMIDGRIAKNQYRRFRIKSEFTNDDPQMLKEVVSRRLNHPDWPWPEVILLDGGRTQLSTVAPHVPAAILLLGLVKHPDRICLFKKSTQTWEYLKLDSHLPEDRLLQTLRDEAHRFANSYRRTQHQQHLLNQH